MKSNSTSQFRHKMYDRNVSVETLKDSSPLSQLKNITQEREGRYFRKHFIKKKIINAHIQRNYSKYLPLTVMHASYQQDRHWRTFVKIPCIYRLSLVTAAILANRSISFGCYCIWIFIWLARKNPNMIDPVILVASVWNHLDQSIALGQWKTTVQFLTTYVPTVHSMTKFAFIDAFYYPLKFCAFLDTHYT